MGISLSKKVQGAEALAEREYEERHNEGLRRDRAGTTYVNTDEAIREAQAEAQAEIEYNQERDDRLRRDRGGTVYQNTPKKVKEAEAEAEALAKLEHEQKRQEQLKRDRVEIPQAGPSKTNIDPYTRIHLGNKDLDPQIFQEKMIGGVKVVRSCRHPEGVDLHLMAKMTKSTLEPTAAGAKMKEKPKPLSRDNTPLRRGGFKGRKK